MEQKKYSVIYADPPWKYVTYSGNGLARSADHHYPTMTVPEICSLRVRDIAEDNCVLFLWVTMPCLFKSPDVIKAWGFEFKTVAFVWVKQNPRSDSLFWGMGHWTRSNAELCLLCTRGSPKRISARVHQVIVSHVQEHSRKPEEVRNRIVELMGDIPRIELFARRRTDGWDCWGNEVESDIKIKSEKTGGEKTCFRQ